MDKIVWILGAGFSRHLGAPLLGDLFRYSTWQQLRTQYDGDKFAQWNSEACENSLWLYNYGRRFEHFWPSPANPQKKMDGGQVLWGDPEQFLDALETAAQNPKSGLAKTLMAILSDSNGSNAQDLAGIIGGARRVLAGETALFLKTVDTDSERFRPYRDWEQDLLVEGDTVITFNYDLVPEKLTKLKTVDPNPAVKALPEKGIPLFKLHGSLTWKRSADESKEPKTYYCEMNDGDFWLTCPDDQLGIATPGPGKQDAEEPLKFLWDEALRAIRKAWAVVFVGYRFPPTDSNALKRICHALSSDQGDPGNYLAVHTVLGNESERDSARLGSILRSSVLMAGKRELPSIAWTRQNAGRFGNVIQHPLFAQDFFTTMRRDWILEAWKHTRTHGSVTTF